MFRGITVALGVGLIFLWISGLGLNTTATPWVTWLDLASGLLAFGIAAMMRPQASRRAHGGGTIFLSFCIFAIGLATLSSQATPWQAWWNFFFAGALFLVGLGVLIDFDEKRFSSSSLGYRYDYGSPTGFGHGFRFPVDRYYYPPPGEQYATGRAPRHYARPDQRIEEDIYDRLSHAGDLDASEIRVSVKNGEVTLSGVVDGRRSRRYIEEIADNVLGVKDIHNELAIRSHQVAERVGEPKPIRVA